MWLRFAAQNLSLSPPGGRLNSGYVKSLVKTEPVLSKSDEVPAKSPLEEDMPFAVLRKLSQDEAAPVSSGSARMARKRLCLSEKATSSPRKGRKAVIGLLLFVAVAGAGAAGVYHADPGLVSDLRARLSRVPALSAILPRLQVASEKPPSGAPHPWLNPERPSHQKAVAKIDPGVSPAVAAHTASVPAVPPPPVVPVPPVAPVLTMPASASPDLERAAPSVVSAQPVSAQPVPAQTRVSPPLMARPSAASPRADSGVKPKPLPVGPAETAVVAKPDVKAAPAKAPADAHVWVKPAPARPAPVAARPWRPVEPRLQHHPDLRTARSPKASRSARQAVADVF